MSLAIKLSAFVLTSGLGQNTDGPIESEPSIASDDLTGITSSTSSRSGELHLELCVLRILTKSPRATNLKSGIENGGGGGGGGIGISGDCAPIFKFSS